jgi:hypothetical protein
VHRPLRYWAFAGGRLARSACARVRARLVRPPAPAGAGLPAAAGAVADTGR